LEGLAMKSSFSNSTGNCVDVTKRRDGTVVVIDTKNKTGDVELLFTPEEWTAFVLGVKTGQFDHVALPYTITDDRPMTTRERQAALRRAGKNTTARTPENLAYVNGQHAERAGWVPYTLEMFARRYNLDITETATKRMYEAFQTGRRAEAHEISMKDAQ
jgi:hypothetical protein